MPHFSAPHEKSSRERVREWSAWARANGLLKRERLLPELAFDVADTMPDFMRRTDANAVSKRMLAAEIKREGPWTVPLYVGHDLYTLPKPDNIMWMNWRTNLCGMAIEHLCDGGLSDMTFLDMATRNGTFAFDVAHRGGKHVTAFDLRAENISQCRWLNTRYGFENIDFKVGNALEWESEPYDVVLNYGLLYHVNEPHKLMKRTFDLCKKFAIVDSSTRREPIDAFFLVSDLDTSRTSVGEYHYEMHPTYRALIALMKIAGFVNIQEIVSTAAPKNPLYTDGTRHALVGFKLS
jgi:2-polyprenyl-3-methyl-5-hydroxy-6-metoxy-1,4-benzoquinol methylase